MIEALKYPAPLLGLPPATSCPLFAHIIRALEMEQLEYESKTAEMGQTLAFDSVIASVLLCGNPLCHTNRTDKCFHTCLVSFMICSNSR